MALYLVSYDIKDTNQDYESLWKFLRESGAKRILYSEWAVPWDASSSAINLANKISGHILKDDTFYVTELFDSDKTESWRGLKISDDAFREMLTLYARHLPG